MNFNLITLIAENLEDWKKV